MTNIENKGTVTRSVKMSVPTYQHYVDHFEELYRQSPLAKVVLRDVSPSMGEQHAKPVSPAEPASTSGVFKTPFASPALKQKPASASANVYVMSPVAKLIHQMQRQAVSSVSPHPTDKGQDALPRPGSTGQAVSSVTPRPADICLEDKENIEAQDVGGDYQGGVGNNELEENLPRIEGEGLEGGAGDELVAGGPEADDGVGHSERDEEMDSAVDTTSTADEVKKSSPKPGQKESEESVRKSQRLSKQSHQKQVERDVNNHKETPKSSQKKETVLDNWIIKWLGSGRKHIAVEGHRENDPEGSFWQSTPIAVRVSSRVVQTSTGSLYRLVGSINKLQTIDQGFSLETVKKFRTGFPVMWESLLVEEVFLQKHMLQPVVNSNSTDTSEALVTEKKKSGSHAKAKTGKGAEKQTPVTGKDKRTKELQDKRTPATKKKNTTPANTPTFIDVREVRTTHSGRKVIPPLDYWTGQRQRPLHHLHATTEILEGSMDYTPVSATRVKVKGSVNISERDRRRIMRPDNSAHKRNITKKKILDSSSNSIQDTNIASQAESLTDHPEIESSVDKGKTGKRGKDQEKRSRRKTNSQRNCKRDTDTDSEAKSLAESSSDRPGIESSLRDDKIRKRGKEQEKRDQRKEAITSQVYNASQQEKEVTSSTEKTRSTGANIVEETQQHARRRSLRGGAADDRDQNTKRTAKNADGGEGRETGAKHVSGTNPYDLYGSVLSVIEMHHQRCLASRKEGRRHLQKEKVGEKTDTAESGDRNDSYNISDDEDFRSDISVTGSNSMNRQSLSPGKTSSTNQARRSSRRGSTGLQDPSAIISRQGEKLESRSKRRGSDVGKARVLLGSNMLPERFVELQSEGEKDTEEDKAIAATVGNKETVDGDTNANHQEAPELNMDTGKLKDTRRRTRSSPQIEPGLDDAAKRNGKQGKTSRKSQRTVATSDSSDGTPKSHKSQQQKRTRQQKDKGEDRERDTGDWQPDELHRFQKAMKTIPPSSRQFWHRVAASVGSRSEWECQQLHQARLERAETKAPRRTRASKKDPEAVATKATVALTAGKGTMRRKRQLKELIQQHNQNTEEDDLFDSAPFKKQKMAMKTVLNLHLSEEDDEDDDEAFAKTPGSARLKTPSGRSHTLLVPLSGKKTPHSSLISPGLLRSVDKKHMDQYIHGLQKKRPGGRRVKQTPKSSHRGRQEHREAGRGTITMTPSVSEAFQVDPIPEEREEEEDGEGGKDYYWSDEES